MVTLTLLATFRLIYPSSNVDLDRAYGNRSHNKHGRQASKSREMDPDCSR